MRKSNHHHSLSSNHSSPAASSPSHSPAAASYISPVSTRIALARRLSQLAQQLTSDEYFDEHALTGQIDMMEKVMATPLRSHATTSRNRSSFEEREEEETPLRRRSLIQTPPARSYSPLGTSFRGSRPSPGITRSPTLDFRPSSPAAGHQYYGHRSRSSAGSIGGYDKFSGQSHYQVDSRASPIGSPSFAGLATSFLSRHQSLEPTVTETQEPQNIAISTQQVKDIAAEAIKLNEELNIVVTNLKARQEEADHIHSLLIERAETAAQRIIFLQNRIAYLEQELQDNDGELQHLRICLKAVQIQLPPHPDREIQRCIASFKEDYKAMKKKRAERKSVSAGGGGGGGVAPSLTAVYDTSTVDFAFSPLRTPFRRREGGG